jgi:hypothetical protein
MVDAYDTMLAGNFIDGLLQTYTDVWGPNAGALFYGVVFTLILASMYITTQDVTIPAIIALILGFAMIESNKFPPEAHKIGYLFVVFAVTTILFKIRGLRRTQ